jgi:hypothetical protein
MNNTRDIWSILFLGGNAAVFVHKSLLPMLSTDVLRSIDNDPNKFRGVKNHFLLFRLFLIYVNSSSREGRVIQEIYRTNISDFYIYKSDVLDLMDIMINQKEATEKSREALQ